MRAWVLPLLSSTTMMVAPAQAQTTPRPGTVQSQLDTAMKRIEEQQRELDVQAAN